jgi:hypothetical protein
VGAVAGRPTTFFSVQGCRGRSSDKRMHVCQYVQFVGSLVVGLRKGDSPVRGFGAVVTPGALEVVGRGHVRGQQSDKTENDTNDMSGIDSGENRPCAGSRKMWRKGAVCRGRGREVGHGSFSWIGHRP